MNKPPEEEGHILTFVSGWRSIDRDRALLDHRDIGRSAAIFIEDASTFPSLLPTAPIIDLYRNGRIDFNVGADCETLIRLNYDTEQDLTVRAITHFLMQHSDAQIVVTFDAIRNLSRLFPALRSVRALLASNSRLDAPSGDRVLFTRGGSFIWTDRLLEAQTSLLVDSEVVDAGIIPEVVEEDEY